MHAPPKRDYPIATLETLTSFDAYLLGIPTRYGIMPAQWKARTRLTTCVTYLIFFPKRPSGIRPVVSGLVGGSLENTPASLFQLVLCLEDKKLLP